MKGQKTPKAKTKRKGTPDESQWRCIVTGFDAFAGAESNPTEILVKRLPQFLAARGKGKVPIVTGVLPTCCAGSWKTLKGLLRDKGSRKAVLVMLGQAAGRQTIGLERVALNLRDYRIPDNEGHQWAAEKIYKDSENAFISRLPLDKWARDLTAKGIPVEVSNFAGTFVCNEIYFRAWRQAQKNRSPQLVLFIHVPLPADFAKFLRERENPPEPSKKKGRGQKKGAAEAVEPAEAADDLGVLREALEQILKLCLKEVG